MAFWGNSPSFFGTQNNAAYGMGIAPAQQNNALALAPQGGVAVSPDPYAGMRFQPVAGGYGTQQPTGFDQISPGTGEQFFQQNEPGWGMAGNAEQYWNQQAGKFNTGAAYTDQEGKKQHARVTDRAQQIGGMADAGLGPYYDVARRRLSDTMNREAAARGTFGSSRTMDMMGDAQAALAAEQANREFQARLQALQEARLWEGAGSGMLGQNADLGLRYLTGGMSAAQASDAARMARLNAGMNAAAQAQQLQQGRGNRAFDEMYANQAMWAPMLQEAYGGMFEGDQALMDAAMAAQVQGSKEALEQDYHRAEKEKADADWAYDKIPILGMLSG